MPPPLQPLHGVLCPVNFISHVTGTSCHNQFSKTHSVSFPFFPQRNLDHVWSLVPTALLTLVVSSGCEPRSLEVFLSVVQGACGLLQVFSSLRRQDSLLASRLRFLLPGLGHSAQLVDKWYGEQSVTMPLPVLGTGHPIGAAQTPDL